MPKAGTEDAKLKLKMCPKEAPKELNLKTKEKGIKSKARNNGRKERNEMKEMKEKKEMKGRVRWDTTACVINRQ